MKPRQKRRDAIAVDGPARVRADHVRDRALPHIHTQAWRRLSALEAAYEKGQLEGGSARFSAAMRFEAGKAYARAFSAAAASGRDSTDLERLARGGEGVVVSETQLRALGFLAAVEKRIGGRDATIVRMVCGEGYLPIEAVRTVCGDYRHATASRFREALDSLIEAMAAMRKEKPGP